MRAAEDHKVLLFNYTLTHLRLFSTHFKHFTPPIRSRESRQPRPGLCVVAVLPSRRRTPNTKKKKKRF